MPNGEQLDLSVENTLQSYVYSAASDKEKNHILTIDPTQTQYTKDNLTNWTLDLNIKGILANYLFAELKRWRTFEGIRTNMNSYNDVNSAINNYMNFNVIDRYKLSSIDLYLRYKDLRSQNLLRYKNVWNPDIVSPTTKFTKFQSEMSVDGGYAKVTFNQQQPSSSYTFEYFFNLYFEKL